MTSSCIRDVAIIVLNKLLNKHWKCMWFGTPYNNHNKTKLNETKQNRYHIYGSLYSLTCSTWGGSPDDLQADFGFACPDTLVRIRLHSIMRQELLICSRHRAVYACLNHMFETQHLRWNIHCKFSLKNNKQISAISQRNLFVWAKFSGTFYNYLRRRRVQSKIFPIFVYWRSVTIIDICLLTHYDYLAPNTIMPSCHENVFRITGPLWCPLMLPLLISHWINSRVCGD